MMPSDKNPEAPAIKNQVTSRHSSQPPDRSGFRPLLDKYVAVWIWSIAFGTSVGVLYSLARVSSGGRWGLAALVPTLIAAIGALFVLSALRHLINYLRYYLLPEFFGLEHSPLFITPDGDEEAEDSEEEGERAQRAAISLLVAFERLLLALGCRIVAGLIESGLRSLG